MILDLTRSARWLSAMQAEDWGSPAIPDLDELCSSHPGWPTPTSDEETRVLVKVAFANALNRHLWSRTPHPVVVPQGERLVSSFTPRCMADAPWIELWRRAQDVKTVLRPCRGCSGLFQVAASNRKRAYCFAQCKNLFQSRRWYSNSKNRKKILRKRREIRPSGKRLKDKA